MKKSIYMITKLPKRQGRELTNTFSFTIWNDLTKHSTTGRPMKCMSLVREDNPVSANSKIDVTAPRAGEILGSSEFASRFPFGSLRSTLTQILLAKNYPLWGAVPSTHHLICFHTYGEETTYDQHVVRHAIPDFFIRNTDFLWMENADNKQIARVNNFDQKNCLDKWVHLSPVCEATKA